MRIHKYCDVIASDDITVEFFASEFHPYHDPQDYNDIWQVLQASSQENANNRFSLNLDTIVDATTLFAAIPHVIKRFNTERSYRHSNTEYLDPATKIRTTIYSKETGPSNSLKVEINISSENNTALEDLAESVFNAYKYYARDNSLLNDTQREYIDEVIESFSMRELREKRYNPEDHLGIN